MKRVSILAAVLASSPVLAAAFMAEEPMADVPAEVAAVIERLHRRGDYVDRKGEPCRFVGKAVALEGGGPAVDWIATTSNARAWAASAAPVWVLRNGEVGYKVVLITSRMT